MKKILISSLLLCSGTTFGYKVDMSPLTPVLNLCKEHSASIIIQNDGKKTQNIQEHNLVNKDVIGINKYIRSHQPTDKEQREKTDSYKLKLAEHILVIALDKCNQITLKNKNMLNYDSFFKLLKDKEKENTADFKFLNVLKGKYSSENLRDLLDKIKDERDIKCVTEKNFFKEFIDSVKSIFTKKKERIQEKKKVLDDIMSESLSPGGHFLDSFPSRPIGKANRPIDISIGTEKGSDIRYVSGDEFEIIKKIRNKRKEGRNKEKKRPLKSLISDSLSKKENILDSFPSSPRGTATVAIDISGDAGKSPDIRYVSEKEYKLIMDIMYGKKKTIMKDAPERKILESHKEGKRVTQGPSLNDAILERKKILKSFNKESENKPPVLNSPKKELTEVLTDRMKKFNENSIPVSTRYETKVVAKTEVKDDEWDD